MYKTLLKNGTSIAFIVGFIVSLFIIVTTVMGVGSDIRPDDFEALGKVGAFSTAVILAVIFIGLALLAIFVGGIWGLISDPKSALKFVIGIVGLLVLVVILYAVSKEETSGVVASLNQEYDIQGSITRFISAGIMLTLALLVVGIGAILLGELRNAFK